MIISENVFILIILSFLFQLLFLAFASSSQLLDFEPYDLSIYRPWILSVKFIFFPTPLNYLTVGQLAAFYLTETLQECFLSKDLFTRLAFLSDCVPYPSLPRVNNSIISKSLRLSLL